MSTISAPGCLRLFCPALTLTLVPSIIFKRPCCTPSPLTSLVTETFCDFFVILSISSTNTIPRCASSMFPSASVTSLVIILSTSSPTYPASVSVVASQIANGTLRKSAIVCAINVLPDPVGPITITLVLSNLISSLGLFNFL